MIDILSLPRRNTLNLNQLQIKKINFKSGLPINSLPGWEHIPFNCKLPMLKCPGNQVIFSKNKIGQTFKTMDQEFDPSGRDKIPEYNPLHDSNLKTFYSNERNLKRLRENGEITDTNDVICNLKDFNEYRQQLHKSHLYYVLRAYNQKEAEQHDRMLITNAEGITTRDHQNLAARHHSYNEVLQNKRRLDDERHNRYVRLAQITEEKFQRIASLAEMQKTIMEHRKILNSMRMQQHLDVCSDLQRKHLIMLKKLFQFKKERFKKNLRLLKQQRMVKATEVQIHSWRKRLDERIQNQKRLEDLQKELSKERKQYIEDHKVRYLLKWEQIQEDIRKRARQTSKRKEPKQAQKRKTKRKKQVEAKEETKSFCDEQQPSFERLLDSDLCQALNAAIAIEGKEAVKFDPDDPIYKAAEFILNHILTKFEKDLSTDPEAVRVISERLSIFIDEAKQFVTYKATQIISFGRERKKTFLTTLHKNRTSRASHVSFSGFASTIGIGFYEIHPFVDVRPVSERRPTPLGSLASMVVTPRDEDDPIPDKIRLPHLCRNEIVFIEHYIVTFKRELLVGMDKQVFAAIQSYFDNKIMDVRQELLDLDKQFLVDQMTKAILSYAVNSLNFDACIRLCISALSAEIIWALQKELLRPDRDPRAIVKPSICCRHEPNTAQLCLYCH